ncbi:unnamed protein product [Amoebophrya sp. A120]|nr:unnamed protein product [Amoebophrya sp. A120]|eukprot:GSA120T00016385001.1
MSKIIAAPNDDQNQDVFPVARMIQQLMKDNNTPDAKIEQFEQSFVSEIEKDNGYAIFQLFAEQCDLIVTQQEKKRVGGSSIGSVQEKIECYFSTLIYMLGNAMDTVPKLQAAVSKVVELLLSGQEYPQLRLKMLMQTYNSIPITGVTAEVSRKIFFGVLNFAADNELFHEMVVYLNDFETWMSTWAQHLEDNEDFNAEADKKELYHLIAMQIPKLKPEVKLSMASLPEELAFQWLEKYLRYETEVNDRSLAAIKLFVQEVIKLPSVFEVEGLLEIEVLQKASKSNDKVAKMVALLQLFVSGTIADLAAFKSKHTGFLQELDVPESCIENKLRVLTLCSLCEGRQEVPLKEIREALKIEDVDDLIIEATHYNVLVGRIDEVRQILTVQSVLQRKFGQKEWQHLDNVLEKWMGKIDLLIDSLKVSAEKERASAGKIGGA